MSDVQIPVVDLRLADEDGAGRRVAADALAGALESASCCWLIGHGISPDVLERIYTDSIEFFALPREVKAEVQWTGNGLWRGWQPVTEGGEEYGGDVRSTDLLERLEQNLSSSAGGPDSPENRWPERPPRLRSSWEAYHDEAERLTSTLVELLAESLGLPATDLPAWTTGQFSNLVANHYHALETPPAPGRVRSHPHRDHGGLTVLYFDDAPGGLEVRYGGQWVAVEPVAGALLVQAGDLLERWTNGRIRGNLHRVVTPPADVAAGAARQSIVFFHHPDLDAEIAPAPSLVDGDRPSCEPVICREHVHGRQLDYRTSTT